ncbi:C-type lectin domain family 4 member E-like [Mercenaria mercenaria]|uniref:C-type lectin domain family 4 member E-like n=1 Tax=Mercenaria mercenaria TaxID=6596 RepID=UPI001E1DF74F|nr:C-type lectin domain family 4 member E-like [Mercenaria mercenaria]
MHECTPYLLNTVNLNSMLYLLLIISFLSPDFVYSGTTSCRDAWVVYYGSCYLFAHDQLLTFTEAEEFCKHHSSHLVHIDNEHENNFLRQFVIHFRTNAWWIGLTDVLVEGEWQWIDTNTDAKYLQWGPNEPDNVAVEEDCAAIALSQGLHGLNWADTVCSNKLQPICEENVSTENEIIG